MMLGNLTLDQIEMRAGIKLPPELRTYMEPRQQQKADDISSGKWHCFDMPFTLVCGDMETAKEIYGHLKSLSAQFREPLQISIQK